MRRDFQMNALEKAIELIELDKWDESHNIVQGGDNKYYYLIHGLLHRIEGNMSNAKYWYNQADEVFPDNTISTEIQRIKELIEKQS